MSRDKVSIEDLQAGVGGMGMKQSLSRPETRTKREVNPPPMASSGRLVAIQEGVVAKTSN
jgi:hypothetical protein